MVIYTYINTIQKEKKTYNNVTDEIKFTIDFACHKESIFKVKIFILF